MWNSAIIVDVAIIILKKLEEFEHQIANKTYLNMMFLKIEFWRVQAEQGALSQP